MPRVTAVMPTYNRSEFIASAVQGFLSQTYADAELLIVDDGTDATAELVPTHPCIRYVKLPTQELSKPGAIDRRRSTGEMRNICAELAQGKVIVHMDSDDWYSPEYLATMVALLKTSRKWVVGMHEILYWHMADCLAYRFKSNDLPYASGHSLTYFKSYWQNNRFLDRRIGEDSDFSFKAHQNSALASFPNMGIAVARRHQGNTGSVNLRYSNAFAQIAHSELPDAFMRTVYGKATHPVIDTRSTGQDAAGNATRGKV